MAARKYVLTKVAAGDYLLPSNDGLTVYRIARYTDGPSNGLTDWPRDRELWGLWQWPESPAVYVDTSAWDRWDQVGHGFTTRQEAIDDAMERT